MVIKLDWWDFLQDRQMFITDYFYQVPIVVVEHFATQMLTRELFALANLPV